MPKSNGADESIRNAFRVLEMVVQKAISNARMEGHNEALASIRNLVAGGAPVKRGPGRPMGSKNKPKQKRKNSWEGLSPADRLKRVNAIRKGKGLPPKEKL